MAAAHDQVHGDQVCPTLPHDQVHGDQVCPTLPHDQILPFTSLLLLMTKSMEIRSVPLCLMTKYCLSPHY